MQAILGFCLSLPAIVAVLILLGKAGSRWPTNRGSICYLSVFPISEISKAFAPWARSLLRVGGIRNAFATARIPRQFADHPDE